MGLEIRFDPTGTSLWIKSVVDTGAVYAAGVDIAVGARIVVVSGVEGDPSVLLSQVQSSESPQLLISRCPTS